MVNELDHSFNGDGARYCLGRPVSLAEKDLFEFETRKSTLCGGRFRPTRIETDFPSFLSPFYLFFRFVSVSQTLNGDGDECCEVKSN